MIKSLRNSLNNRPCTKAGEIRIIIDRLANSSGVQAKHTAKNPSRKLTKSVARLFWLTRTCFELMEGENLLRGSSTGC